MLYYYVDTPARAQELERKEPQVVVDHLRSLYDQGVPFFSHRTFQEVIRQLDHYHTNPSNPPTLAHSTVDSDDSDSDDQNRPIISLPAIDGTVVQTRLKTGFVKPGDEENTEFVLRSPCLYYRTFQNLCHDILASSLSPQQAYCAIQLNYPMQLRRIDTHKHLDSVEREDPRAVQNAFEDGVKEWERSPFCHRLRGLIDAMVPPRVTISKIVAFACSTMTVKSQQECSISQHALVLTMLDVLQSRQQRNEGQLKIRCVAQDPCYDDTDEEMLGRAGVTVAQDPRGLVEVDNQSVVISFSPDFPIRQIIADIARPAILIWDRVTGQTKDAENCTDPESPRLWTMIDNHYDKVMDLGPKETFGDAVVYVRRE